VLLALQNLSGCESGCSGEEEYALGSCSAFQGALNDMDYEILIWTWSEIVTLRNLLTMAVVLLLLERSFCFCSCFDLSLTLHFRLGCLPSGQGKGHVPGSFGLGKRRRDVPDTKNPTNLSRTDSAASHIADQTPIYINSSRGCY